MFSVNGKLSRLYPQLTAADTIFLNEQYKVHENWEVAFRGLLDSKNIDHSKV